MTGNVTAFNAAIKRFAEKTVPEEVVKLQKKICLDALGKLVLRTPVRTGRARGGWQVAIAGKAQVVTALLNMAERHEKLDPSGATTIRAGAALIAECPPFACVTISNNVSYILELEDGKSSQAPNGMLALTFSELANALR
jgi:hypothetical protein